MRSYLLKIGKIAREYIKTNQLTLLVNLYKDAWYELTYNNGDFHFTHLDLLKCFMNQGMNINILDEENNLLVLEQSLLHVFDMRFYDFILGKNINLNLINIMGDTILDKVELLCLEYYNKKDSRGMDFELSNIDKYQFYRDLILLMKAYNAKCSYELEE